MGFHKEESFDDTGLVNLTMVNWNCPQYQRTVVASLVEGVYVVQKHREKILFGSSQPLDDRWWQHFHFEIVEYLIDEDDASTFGAIYRYKYRNDFMNAPKFVIAFRGTLLQCMTALKDIKLGWNIFQNSFHKKSRSKIGIKQVKEHAEKFGAENVWLAGHSQGAALATLAGKSMATIEIYLKTFLFNPPFCSIPIELLCDELETLYFVAHDFIVCLATIFVKGTHHKSERFKLLNKWVPNVYVNPSDFICSTYIGYFEHRKVMAGMGAEAVAKLATENSFRGLIPEALEKDRMPSHLIQSAILHVNRSSSIGAHSLLQWVKPGLNLVATPHIYN